MTSTQTISEPFTTVDQATFRHVLGHVASGATVVTACQDGFYHGTTVSSFCSLSLEPPLVLVCLDLRSTSHRLIDATSVFAVNFLAEGDEWLSRHFASRTSDKFANIPYHLGQTGAPLLDDALATLECQLVGQYSGGDHSIFVGEVVAAHAEDEKQPLLYFRSSYHRL